MWLESDYEALYIDGVLNYNFDRRPSLHSRKRAHNYGSLNVILQKPCKPRLEPYSIAEKVNARMAWRSLLLLLLRPLNLVRKLRYQRGTPQSGAEYSVIGESPTARSESGHKIYDMMMMLSK